MKAALLAMVERYWFLAGQVIVVAGEVVAQRLAHLAQGHLDEDALLLFADGDPDDTVGKGLLHDLVVAEGLASTVFPMPPMPGQRGEGDGPAAVVGDQGVTQTRQSSSGRSTKLTGEGRSGE